MKDNTKKVLKTVGAIGSVGAAAYFLIGNVFYYGALTKSGMNNPIAKKLVSPNKAVDEYTQLLNDGIMKGAEWFENADREKLVIHSDAVKKNIHADYLFADKPTDICAVVIHGYGSCPAKMGVYAEKYHELGYNVLMPSLNGHADSESDIVTMGWKDRLVVIDWINYLVENYPDVKIIIHGVSMGAATTMMTTGEELPENVKVAVADCGYTSVWDIFSDKVKGVAKLHDFPTLYSANTVNKLYSGFDLKKASSVEQVKKSKTPTIFIHGEKDTFVPYAMLDRVYDAAACEKAKVTIPNAPHARNACANPELYWGSIIEFISKYL